MEIASLQHYTVSDQGHGQGEKESFYIFHNINQVLYLMLRLVTCNRLVNLGISKQQHWYLKTKI